VDSGHHRNHIGLQVFPYDLSINEKFVDDMILSDIEKGAAIFPEKSKLVEQCKVNN
jgi:hypothetical protein